ncbi:hypothetical protein KP509_25G053100 [Ceratopteris richardii]|uniref:C2 NT-type domain-containing protein n=1 Tax=Ceratopteris richardii TaxID=49495 RepID=A0A8T2RQF9_CERRI|nr:hypothetical protein KP509_25G053100 [Ceratopteris richardii]
MVFFFSSLKSRTKRCRFRHARFIYRLHLSEIKPWFSTQQRGALASFLPFSANSFVLRWQRGAHRSGLVRSKSVSEDGVIVFNCHLELPVTFHCSSSSSTFDEKLIHFTLINTDYSDASPLARGSLNLASYRTSVTNDTETVFSARIALVLCQHVSFKALVPHLHLFIIPSPYKAACFGELECRQKAQSLIKCLPTQTLQLLKRKQESSPVSLNYGAAAVPHLRSQNLESDEELTIEAFTDDESSSGQCTPSDRRSPRIHQKINVSTINIKDEDFSDSPPLSSRYSGNQLALTPTSRKASSAEDCASMKTAADFYNSNKEVFIIQSQNPSLTNFNNDRLVCAKDLYLIQTTASLEHSFEPEVKQDTKKIETALMEDQHDRYNYDLTGLLAENQPKCNSRINCSQYSTEAVFLHQNITNQLNESMPLALGLDDLDSELLDVDDDFSVEENMNVLEDARRKFVEGSEKRDAKITRRLLEETRMKLISAEAKLFATSEKLSFLQMNVGALEGELQDAATIEMFIFCTLCEHKESPHSVFTCACYLALLHNFALRNWSQQRKESLIKSTISGILLAIRACGPDLSRLTFWLSNVVVLRHMLTLALDTSLVSSSSDLATGLKNVALDDSRGWNSVESNVSASDRGLQKPDLGNLIDATSFSAALQKVEAFVYVKIVEEVWSQVFAPMICTPAYCSLYQGPENNNGTSIDGSRDHRRASMVFDIEDGMEQNLSIDTWKKAFLDALQKLCPLRFGGKNCTCVPGLFRLVIEDCLARLDVLMFNAILPTDESDPLSQPFFDEELLPIPPGPLTFASGVQLKNVVSTWSTWLTILLEKIMNKTEQPINDESRHFFSFPLLKALADLLMLPKDMIADESVRKEVCPVLTLPAIKRIISVVEPDEFAPEPVSPSLLAALNAEIDMEKWMHGQTEEHGFTATGVAIEPEKTAVTVMCYFMALRRWPTNS